MQIYFILKCIFLVIIHLFISTILGLMHIYVIFRCIFVLIIYHIVTDLYGASISGDGSKFLPYVEQLQNGE